eukprot:m.18234 g.18234  ORF g.18234 m.18234 type:complete len:69 (+) comp11907_c0_seq1:259-465(+)
MQRNKSEIMILVTLSQSVMKQLLEYNFQNQKSSNNSLFSTSRRKHQLEQSTQRKHEFELKHSEINDDL